MESRSLNNIVVSITRQFIFPSPVPLHIDAEDEEAIEEVEHFCEAASGGTSEIRLILKNRMRINAINYDEYRFYNDYNL